jgi:hypothetical protein
MKTQSPLEGRTRRGTFGVEQGSVIQDGRKVEIVPTKRKDLEWIILGFGSLIQEILNLVFDVNRLKSSVV